MKKRKFNILLNIATLCLCITAIAFGVYSAKTASLNVSGTIGFNAHNVDYDVTGTIVGHSGTDGLPVTTAEALTKDSSGNLVLGSRTFSDLGVSGEVETITVELTITNKSAFAILVKVNLPESTTADSNIVIDSPKDHSAVILADKNATDTTKTGKIQFTLNVKSGTQEIATTNAVSLKVDLAKTDIAVGTSVRADAAIKQLTTAEVESIKTGLGSVNMGSEKYEYGDTYKCYAERYPYYVEMGEVNSEKVKWLIVGTFANDSVIALTDSDKTPLSQGLMLKNTTYVMLSEKVLYSESTTNYGISFQNKYTNSGDYLNDYGYSAQDYATSNIRNYLKGVDVSRSAKSSSGSYIPDGTSVNLLTTYNLTSDPLYAKIQERTLTSLYNESAITNETKEMKTVPTTKTGYTAVDSTSDKLWLLSQTEMEEIFKADYVENTRESYSSPLYMSSRTSVIGASSPGSWWLRSPDSSRARTVRGVDDYGYLSNFDANYVYYGSRAAFLF